MKPIHIAYEDDIIIIAEKPAGMPSLETLDPKRPHFFGELKKFLHQRHGRETYLAIHHRLDVETSGLLVFCKKKGSNKLVGELFSERKIHKTYLAICDIRNKKNLPGQWNITNFLARSKKNKMKMTAVQSGGDKAITDFELLHTTKEMALIKANPQTGRMHQIRVHLSEFGMPIAGDSIYGEKNLFGASRTMLHAYKLEFVHPILGTLISVETSVPLDFKQLVGVG